MKKIVAINASPRIGWNTDILVDEASQGAKDNGVEIIKYDMVYLEKFTGCVSCFGCKQEMHQGKCTHRDGLTKVLDDIRTADGLIIGTPNYFGDVTAMFRSLYERLMFQYLTYNRERFSCNDHSIPVLLIMTSNAPEGSYASLMEGYKATFERFIGPTKVLLVGETQQVHDYSMYNWTMFDGAQRVKRREEVFPSERKKAYELGKGLIEG